MSASALASSATEIRRLRGENAQLRALAFAADPAATPEYWRDLYRDAHQADLEEARRDERQRVEAEYDDLWRTWAAAWSEDAQIAVEPDGPAARASSARRLRAAEAGCRRDAADWERGYVARAHNTHDRNRTPEQRATCHLYPSAPAARRTA